MHEIRYSPEFNKDYVKLRERADRGEGEAKYLIELISKATAKLAENTEAGRKIPHRLWPKEYAQKYDVKSLWKLNLDSSWRLIYTITGTQAQLFLIYSKLLIFLNFFVQFAICKEQFKVQLLMLFAIP